MVRQPAAGGLARRSRSHIMSWVVSFETCPRRTPSTRQDMHNNLLAASRPAES